MKATYKKVQQAIARHYPDTIFYQHAHPIVLGEGRKRRKWPRKAGHSADYLLSVEITGEKKNVRRVSFMFPGFPEVIEKMTAVAQGVILDLYPDWTGEQWLKDTAGTLKDGEEEKLGQVAMSCMKMQDIPVRFVIIS